MNIPEKRKELAQTELGNVSVEIVQKNIRIRNESAPLETYEPYRKTIKIKGIGNIAGIEITYTGKMKAKINKPDSWLAMGENNKIVLVDIAATPIDANEGFELIDFDGDIKIESIIFGDYNLNKSIGTITHNKTSEWANNENTYDTDTTEWQNFGEYEKNNTIKKTKIDFGVTKDESDLFGGGSGWVKNFAGQIYSVRSKEQPKKLDVVSKKVIKKTSKKIKRGY